ncbi:hypothetical protein DFH07DRAFT_107813 [Mycena maculata]|uniref:TEA domain-containing protein n=1 Tax=Mycena maculata TaxID=230809 RepID=A0AAD7JYS0_9AGAR|nr:hypothetical protein DFH07DRAFT_107813 [Mycena maculata]
MDDPQQSPKTLTPQRKHRKLLKDGSGTAVWPESVESVFVQGLREYWDSPWATYSRGRSRWRNQFLVDYLQNLGIVRSKKQVASHIQVLRNMWKGEPEYQLVAGGEELYPDPGVKVEYDDQPALLTIDGEEDAASSSLSNSPPEFNSEFPPSPGEASSPMFPGLTYSPSSPLSSIPDLDSPPNAFSNLAPYPSYQQKAYPPPLPPAVRYPNRTTSLTLLADGMTPFIVDLDKLAPPAPLPARTPPLVLRLRLTLAPLDDVRAPPTLQGFFASVCLAGVWSVQAKAYTRVYNAAGQCFSDESAALHASSVELGSVVAQLPESALSRARWCDAAVQTTLTQQVVIDGSPLLFLVYELDRHPGPSALPSVDLVSFQKYAGAGVDAKPSVNTKPPPEPAYTPYSPQGVYSTAYSSPASAPTFSPTYSPPAAQAYASPANTSTYSPPYYVGAYPPQPQPQTYAPTTASSYTPSLSSALTPVSLRP